MIQPEQLIKLAEDLQGPAERYLKWKQVVNRYDRGKKSKLAELMGSHEGSVAARETEAYASEEWATYLNEWDMAEKNMVKAQVVYDNLKTRFDALTSALAYQREHMKRLGG